MGASDYLYGCFLKHLEYTPTSCQENMLRTMADFADDTDSDILVVDGYAGTGKTSAVAAVIAALKEHNVPVVLLAPTGRAAKVLSNYAGMPAFTVHKHIYRQKAVDGDGYGMFSLYVNKLKNAFFFVDEVSLVGIDSGSQTSMFGSGNLLEDLVTFVRNGLDCKLVLIGDRAQLPPVGLDASPALSPDYMSLFGGVRYCSLTTVVRQKKESGILFNATLLRTMMEDPMLDDICPKFRVEGYGDIERIGGGDLIEKLSDAYSTYGEDETIVLCRSNRRAIKYNAGIRATVQYKEEKLVRGDKLMIVKNCYQFVEDIDGMDYIANGDMARLEKIWGYEERYGLHFAQARLTFPDYDDQEISAKVILDTLESESAALTNQQQNDLYRGVNEDYAHISSNKKRYDAVREDRYYNALQLKYADAVTCHKSQGGQWKCVFIDNPFWQDELVPDDLKWLYTALTRGVEKVYLVNFKDHFFE